MEDKIFTLYLEHEEMCQKFEKISNQHQSSEDYITLEEIILFFFKDIGDKHLCTAWNMESMQKKKKKGLLNNIDNIFW